MNIQQLTYLLSHPKTMLKHLNYKTYEIRHPKEPWISPSAIKFCDKVLKQKKMGFEWGSGRSTLWFALRMEFLCSIEHDVKWYKKIKFQIDSNKIKNINYHLIPLNHDINESTQAYYSPLPDYVKAINKYPDETFELVIVDGHYRQACVLAALSKIKKNGFLLIDDTNWLKLSEWNVPKEWPIIHQSFGKSQTTIWQRPLI